MMKLHFREMIEPTGAMEEAINQEIKPEHATLLRMLVADLGLERPDVDLQRLSFCIIGVAVHFFVGQNFIDQISPGVLASPRAIDTLAERLAVYSMGMIEAEEMGITSKNVDEMLKSEDPSIKRFLGVTPGFGKAVGVDEKWMYNVIKQVGNYGESFERNVGTKTPLKLERGQNALWTNGGLMYAIPFR